MTPIWISRSFAQEEQARADLERRRAERRLRTYLERISKTHDLQSIKPDLPALNDLEFRKFSKRNP